LAEIAAEHNTLCPMASNRKLQDATNAGSGAVVSRALQALSLAGWIAIEREGGRNGEARVFRLNRTGIDNSEVLTGSESEPDSTTGGCGSESGSFPGPDHPVFRCGALNRSGYEILLCLDRPKTRAEISNSTHLARSTVSEMLKRMLEHGAVVHLQDGRNLVRGDPDWDAIAAHYGTDKKKLRQLERHAEERRAEGQRRLDRLDADTTVIALDSRRGVDDDGEIVKIG
jgi:hypothetical protein